MHSLMRILVTGVTGQVGSALAARLAPSTTVLAADRNVHVASQRLLLMIVQLSR